MVASIRRFLRRVNAAYLAWLGMRSAGYQCRSPPNGSWRGSRRTCTFTLGLVLLLFAVAVVRTAWIPRPIAYLIGLSGLTYLVQGWMVGSEGFSPIMSNAIVRPRFWTWCG